MSDIARTVLAAALIWAAGVTIFLYLLKRRWFARFTRGFTASLLVALIGIALMATSVIGVWGYQSAKRILDQELIVELQDVGGIVEAQIGTDVTRIESQLSGLATELAPAIAHGAPASDLEARLRIVQGFNERYLQLRVYDANGAPIATSSLAPDAEPPNRIAIAFNLEGKPFVSDAYYSSTFGRQVLYVSLPIRQAGGPIRGIVSARFDLRAELADLIGRSRFNQSGYAVIVDGDGQIIAHPDARRLDTDVSWYPAVQRARANRAVGEVVATNAENRRRLFVYRPLQNPATLGRNPWVLLTEIDQAEEMTPLRAFRRELALGVVLLLVAGIVVARQVSFSIREPIYRISAFARRVREGDLTAQVDVSGRDVAGQLATSLNDMVAGLRERDHVKDVFGRYIATQISDEILKGQTNLGGEARTVTILFSDIRNFSAMSEQMVPQQVVSFLNEYFSEMVEAVFEQGGILDKFMGDGLMAVFGSVGDQPDHARRAVLAALRMKALLAKINGVRNMSGKPPIAIGVGVHTDEVVVGNIGSRKRLEYTVIGDGVNTSSRVQALNKEFGTTILITETTYEAVKDEFDCRPMPDAQLRGKKKPIRFYEVVSVTAPDTLARS